ncbi:sugar metabolism cluster protein [Halorubrum saccharovorum]|uniref:Ribonuclease VapC n=1 Tax=Halorubrum saccharovorum TaxID=2248 RepID=A0A081EUN0_9EURY|nr:sugar metabolism cluster protein [Halorubrum saccharovorum]
MLVLDNNVLSDYLNGTDAAREFLTVHESDPWAVSSIVLYEALMGATYGYIDVEPATMRQAVTGSMRVLDVTERTATEARRLQDDLLEEGSPVDQLDALIAASAVEHGGTFATAEKTFDSDTVRSVLDVAVYEPE